MYILVSLSKKNQVTKSDSAMRFCLLEISEVIPTKSPNLYV